MQTTETKLAGNPEQTKTSTLQAQIPQNKIADVYDSVAKVYNLWAWLTESNARNRAIELADISDGLNILEVAVGTGMAFNELVGLNPNGKNLGIDLSPGMLKKARHRLQKQHITNYELRLGSAFKLTCENDSIDLLLNNYMFDLLSFEEMDKVLAEFKRVLKPGMKLVLVNMTQGERIGSRIYDFIYQLSPRLMGGCRGVKLSDRLKSHGLEVETREYHQQFLFPSEVIIARKP